MHDFSRPTGTRPMKGSSMIRLPGTCHLRTIAAAILLAGTGALADTPPDQATTPAATAPSVDPSVKPILDDAQRAAAAGNLDLAAVKLKSALRTSSNPMVRGDLGLVLLRLGNPLDAERELRQALADGAPGARYLPLLFDAMLAMQEYDDLLRTYPAPTDPKAEIAVETLRSRGIALASLGRLDDARGEVDRALAIRRDPNTLVVRARLALQQGDLSLARSLVDEATKLDPNDMMPPITLADITRRAGDVSGALKISDDNVRRAPDNLLAQIQHIALLLDMDRDADAEQAVNQLLVKMPKQPSGTYFKAVLLARKKLYGDAWRAAQGISPEFVQSDPSTAVTIAGIATDAGTIESADSILTALIANHPHADDPAYVRARTLLALVHLKQQKPEAAIAVLEPVKDSKDPVVVGYLAQAALQLRRFDEAAKYLQDGGAATSANPGLQQQLAISNLGRGKIDEGIAQIQALYEADPSQTLYGSLLTSVLARAGRYDEAYAVADKMEQKIGKTSPYPDFYRAQLHEQQGQLKAASLSFAQSLAIDPNFLPSRFSRALMLTAEGDFAGARADLDAVLKIDPANVAAILKKADVASREFNDPQVVSVLEGGIALLPKEPRLRLALAGFYIRRQEYQDAFHVAKAMQDAMPDNLDGMALVASLEMSLGDKAASVTSYRAMVANAPHNEGAKFRLADALLANGDQAEAVAVLHNVVDERPSDVEARARLIAADLTAGHADMALAAAKEFRQAAPGVDADLVLCQTLLQLNRIEEAKTLIEASYAVHPDARLMLKLAEIDRRIGDPRKARERFADWLKAHPKDTGARRAYGMLLIDLGDEVAAREEFEQVVRDQPSDAIALNDLGWLIRKDQPERAIRLVSEALSVAPDSADVIDTLAWVKFGAGQKAEAVPIAEHAHILSPSDPTIAYHLASVLEATGGDRGRARDLVNQAVASNQHFAEYDDAKALAAKFQ